VPNCISSASDCRRSPGPAKLSPCRARFKQLPSANHAPGQQRGIRRAGRQHPGDPSSVLQDCQAQVALLTRGHPPNSCRSATAKHFDQGWCIFWGFQPVSTPLLTGHFPPSAMVPNTFYSPAARSFRETPTPQSVSLSSPASRGAYGAVSLSH